MSRFRSVLALALLAGLSIATMGQAASSSTVEFAADFYQINPSGAETGGKIFIAKDMVRTEMIQNGQQLVQIVDTKNHLTRMIVPAQRAYMEQQGAGPQPGSAQQGEGGEVNPCQGMKGAQCKQLGKEDVGGRSTVKWEIVVEQQGNSMKSIHWIDEERGVALRQEMPNGQQMELKMVGKEEMEGRSVEKWEMEMVQPNKSPQKSYRWFEPELNVILREEFPGGFVRGMRNIRVGAQDPGLFEVPAGFQKITPQQ